jgi:hypothetical protein
LCQISVHFKLATSKNGQEISIGQDFKAMLMEGQGPTKAFSCGLEYGLQTKGKWGPWCSQFPEEKQCFVAETSGQVL